MQATEHIKVEMYLKTCLMITFVLIVVAAGLTEVSAALYFAVNP